MKKLRSSEDFGSYNEKYASKDSGASSRTTSFSHRNFYYKSESVRNGSSSSSARYERDRLGDDDRESPRLVRKRSSHDFDGFDRRKGFDRFRDGGVGCENGGYGGAGGSPSGGNRIAIHRSDSFSGSRREFPKGFRSERDRSRREGSVSSWRRFGSGNKDLEEGVRSRSSGNGKWEERGSSRSSPKAARDLKSPTWSKDSGSEQSRTRPSSPPVSRGFGDAKSQSRSPTRSKDSGSEQSKSVEVKKSDEFQAESGRSSEMEEGELEPEAEPEAEADSEIQPVPEVEGEREGRESAGLDNDVGEAQSENRFEDEDGSEDKGKRAPVKEKEMVVPNGEDTFEAKDCVKEVNSAQNFENAQIERRQDGGGLTGPSANDEGHGMEEALREDKKCNPVIVKDEVAENLTQLEEKRDQVEDINLEGKTLGVELQESNDNDVVEKVIRDANTTGAAERLTEIAEDKGKSVAVSTTYVSNGEKQELWFGKVSEEMKTSSEKDLEGPSTRGFELFSTSPVRRPEKQDRSSDDKSKSGKLALEPLDLSLSLPNVLLPIGTSRDSVPAPGSPSQAWSAQSLSTTFRTNSDGFTASMSFSGSQSFFHNPSCSLTLNSMDNYEQSVGSRPIFQGIDQASQGALPGQSQNESEQKEIPLYQRILMNDSLQQSQAMHAVSNWQTMQGNHPSGVGTSKVASVLDRQLSFNKQLSVGQSKYNDDVGSPSQSAGSHGVGSNYSFDKRRAIREKRGGSLYRTSSQMEMEKLLVGGPDLVESIIAGIASESVYEMAKKFNEMTEQSVVFVRDSIRDIMADVDKRGKLPSWQKVLQKRSDITLDLLLKCHRAQLEIMVALKTGLPEFLRQGNKIASSDLAEIFLNLRCRNLICKSLLPVDGCECKACSRKTGFCSACMCLVCSKFDMASNTCSWVGCDVCLHWCHAECGLRESHIRNGISATGAQGTNEMQFHCVACDHPSEMFGFVKEVFQNFAKEWLAETLFRELECVKRIFLPSADLRGKQLHALAVQMLGKLANKCNIQEVYDSIMTFLKDSSSSKLGGASTSSGKEHTKDDPGTSLVGRDMPWLKGIQSDKVQELELSTPRVPSAKYDDKPSLEFKLRESAGRESLFNELDSIVMIKLAEAKMFQDRADDARREAEGLRRIAIAKNKKIEEEYASRIAKLRLAEAEEIRRQKIEELQSLERAHWEYSSMKMRMEADIKDLLLKMESTRQNLGT